MVYLILGKMIRYFNNDVKRINHTLKVFSFSRIIAEDENGGKNTNKIIAYSAILHDIGIKESEKKYNSSAGNYQEIEGPPLARGILSEFEISEEIINRVCFIVGNHHSYNEIDGLDFQIVVEADFLVNIYEGSMGKEKIENIYENIFKTDKGRELLKTMYL